MKVDVLDHGFVVLHNVSGPVGPANDIDPALSARMCFDKFGASDPSRTRDQDLKLVEYLIKNRHNTPIEMVELWIEMKLPIFVARQFVRHRTVTINEVSARYVKLPAEWYIPKPDHVGVQPKNIKQGRKLAWNELGGKEQLAAAMFCGDLDASCKQSYAQYEKSLDNGIPAELARCFLHVNHYTHWLWKQDLHNVMRFLSLRDHSHAQFEAQAYAQAVLQVLDVALPHTMQLYRKYRRME